MSKSHFKLSYRALAEKWKTTPTTIKRYTAKGCDFDASDQEVARWLLARPDIKKPSAMVKAIYAIPGIGNPYAPQQSAPSEPFNPRAFGAGIEALMARQDAVEERVDKLKEGDIQEALTLQTLVDELNAELARLEASIPTDN